jgi:hypothetical protein
MSMRDNYLLIQKQEYFHGNVVVISHHIQINSMGEFVSSSPHLLDICQINLNPSPNLLIDILLNFDIEGYGRTQSYQNPTLCVFFFSPIELDVNACANIFFRFLEELSLNFPPWRPR